MNRRDDHAGHLLATDSEEEFRSSAYGRLTKDSLRANEQARARQYLCIVWARWFSLMTRFFLLAGLLASFPAFAAQPDRLLLTTGEFPPYQTMTEGKMGGLAINKIKCILDRMKQPYRITMTSWKHAQLLVEDGEYHGVFIATSTPHRNHYAVMSEPLFTHDLYLYFSDMLTDTAITPANKLRWRISAKFGTSEWSNLHQQKFRVIGKPRNAMQLVDLLLKNKVDAVLAYRPEMSKALKQKEMLPNRFRSRLYVVEKAGVYFGKSFLGQFPGFLPNFNRIIPSCSTGNL